MNKLYKLFTATMVVATVAGFASCSDDDDYVPAVMPGNAQVYFSNAQESTVNIVEDQTEFDVLVLRQDTEGELTVNIQANDPSGIFTIPSTVTFADTEATANLHITYDFADIEGNVRYPISLKIDEKDATLYGDASTSFVVLYAPWKSIGECKYTDGLISSLYNADPLTYLVEVEESMTQPGLYRVVNPYGADYPYNEPGDYDPDNNYYLTINATDPTKVYLEESPTGCNWGNGEFIFYSIAGLRLAQGNPAAAEGYYGTVKDGVITFPKGSLLGAMGTDGWYTCNANGKFKLVLPGGVDGDYSVSAPLAGIIDYVGGVKKAVVEVTMGKDVKTVKVAVIPGADTDAAIEGIESESLEGVVTLGYSETAQTADFTLGEEGTYSIVAVAYDKEGGAQETYTTLISYYDNDNWTSLGDGEYSDGMLLPYISEEPFEPMSWEVSIQQHNDKSGLYRVLVPYWPLNEPSAIGALVIDATDPDHVYVPYASSGLPVDGILGWYSDAAMYIDHGYTIEDIVAAGAEIGFGTLAEGVITIPAGAAGILFDGDVSSMLPARYETVITLPAGEAKAKVSRVKSNSFRMGDFDAKKFGAKSMVLRPGLKRFNLR